MASVATTISEYHSVKTTINITQINRYGSVVIKLYLKSRWCVGFGPRALLCIYLSCRIQPPFSCPLIKTSAKLFPPMGNFPTRFCPRSSPLTSWTQCMSPFFWTMTSHHSDISFRVFSLRCTPWCTQAWLRPPHSQKIQYLSFVESAKFEIKYFLVQLCVYMSFLLDPKFYEIKDHAHYWSQLHFQWLVRCLIHTECIKNLWECWLNKWAHNQEKMCMDIYWNVRR